MGFDDVRFPTRISRGSSGGPERRTEIVVTGSGAEERNARWAHSRRRYDVGSGIRTLADLAAVVAFFEERRGRLIGFRFSDRGDRTSGSPGTPPMPTDQRIGTGDGATRVFTLKKIYGRDFAPYERPIRKPVDGSVRAAVAGRELRAGADFEVDPTTGTVRFADAPAAGAVVTSGFAFDVPVRFDTDELFIDYEAFEAGAIPKIPLVEIVV